MAKCAYCGAVTLLYSFEIPICLDCVDARSKGDDLQRKPPQQEPAKAKLESSFRVGQSR
jgi:hypothetical protein